jgi:hypothetical protein
MNAEQGRRFTPKEFVDFLNSSLGGNRRITEEDLKSLLPSEEGYYCRYHIPRVIDLLQSTSPKVKNDLAGFNSTPEQYSGTSYRKEEEVGKSYIMRRERKPKLMPKRIKAQAKLRILRIYEDEMGKPEADREVILEKLGRQYNRSPREIERYIAEARALREEERQVQVLEVFIKARNLAARLEGPMRVIYR